jgi:cytochrome b pre-mRNA-processing protein 3
MLSSRWSSSVTTPPKEEEEEHASKYSSTTKKVVYGLAKVMGYYSTGSTAIRASHDLYNVCAEQLALNKDFYIKGKIKRLYTGFVKLKPISFFFL